MINLLPPQTRANMRIARSNTSLRRYIELLTLALLVVVTAYIAGQYFLSSQQKDVQNVIDTNTRSVKKLEGVQNEATQLSATINTIAGLLSREISFSRMLEQTSALLPQGSVLTGLQFSIEDLKSPLVITAQVDTEAKAAVLLKNLQSSNLFENTQLVSISQIKEESTTTPTTPLTAPDAAPSAPAPTSPYKYNAVINAYFKPSGIGDQQ